MTKRKSKAAQAVADTVAQPAAGGTVIPAEHVIAVAKRAGTGDAVPAGVDHTQALVALATTEVAAINRELGIVAERMDLWRKVGVMGSSDPKIFARYSDMVRERAILATGLVVLTDGKLPSEKEWPEALKVIYNRHISKRVAETRKCMFAMRDHYTRTMEVLNNDKGTYHQKLALLPNPTNRGRKHGSTGGSQDQTQSGGEDKLVQIMKLMNDLTAPQLVSVVQGVEKQGKQRKEYQAAKAGFGPAFMNFINGIAVCFLKHEADIAKGEGLPQAAAK